MITAIPVSKGRLASHFTKAEYVDFYNASGELLEHCINPASEAENCAGKNALLTLVLEKKTERILVRNIGQRMLSRLLNFNVSIWQIDNHEQFSINAMWHGDNSGSRLLTNITEGRPSMNYEKNSHSCSHGSETEHSCCHHHTDADTASDPCCDKTALSSGKSGCCHRHQAD
jgi:predicted Fe-Mo cluster-binding NifX family protein